MSGEQDQLPQGESSAQIAALHDASAGPRRRLTRGRRVLWGLLFVAGAALVAGYLAWTAPRRQLPQIDLQGVHPDVAAAIQRATDAVRRRPRSGDAWGQLGMILHAHEYYAEAATCYQLASRLDPQECGSAA